MNVPPVPGTELVLRRASVDDAGDVWPLVAGFSSDFSPDRRAFHRVWAEVLEDSSMLVAVAESPDRSILGYVLANCHASFVDSGTVAWIEEIMVAAECRRTGVGRLLMSYAEEWALDAGAQYVALATRRAQRFYAALGYDDAARFFKKSLLPR